MTDLIVPHTISTSLTVELLPIGLETHKYDKKGIFRNFHFIGQRPSSARLRTGTQRQKMNLLEYISKLQPDEIKASHVIGSKLDVMAISTVQRLLAMKYFLIEQNKKALTFIQHPEPQNAMQASIDIDSALFFSHLWILGFYEIFRSLDAKVRKNDNLLDAPQKDRLRDLKVKFTRLRVPMAKFKAANKFEKIDAGIAYPIVLHNKGIAWALSRDSAISLDDLFGTIDSFINSL